MKHTKRLFAVLIAVVMVMCTVPVGNVGFTASAYSSPADVDYGTAVARLHELVNILGEGSYFNTTRSTSCGAKSSGHSCNYCYNANIVKQTWFKNLFGSVSTDQFPQTYYTNGVAHARNGWSCFGFGAFAEWYIFKSSNDDIVAPDICGKELIRHMLEYLKT